MTISFISLFFLAIAVVFIIGTAWRYVRGHRRVPQPLQAQSELRRILTAIDDACFIIDNHNHINWANSKLHTLVESEPDQLVGQSCAALFSIPIPKDPLCDTIGEQRMAEVFRPHSGPLTVKIKGFPLYNKTSKRIGTLVKLWDPHRANPEYSSKETIEQLWETLLAKQSTDLEQKNRELEQSGAQLQQLVERIGSIKDQEGIRISRVLSGKLSGLLAHIRTNVASLQKMLGASFEKRTNSVLQVIDSASLQVDAIIDGIRPPVLDGGHLGEAIEKVAAQFEKIHPIQLKTRINLSTNRLDLDRSTAIFRIAQESLTNIARHSGASLAQMSLLDTSDGVALVVEDNGRGVSSEELERASALGVLGMKERAKSLGGRLDIQNRDNGGCIVSLFVPIQR